MFSMIEELRPIFFMLFTVVIVGLADSIPASDHKFNTVTTLFSSQQLTTVQIIATVKASFIDYTEI